MNGRERLLAALAGDAPDRVPFVPNIWQWFYVNRQQGTLPDAVCACPGPVDALRIMGADVMSKFDGLVLRESLKRCREIVEHEGQFSDGAVWSSFTEGQQGKIRRSKMETPCGELTQTWQYAPDAAAPFETEHWWKDFSAEYAAIRCWLQDADWRLDRDSLRAGLDNVSDDGIVLLQVLPTPLKKFHWLAGQEMASYFVADHFEQMRELAKIHQAKSLAVLEEVVDLDGVWAFEIPDNLDSHFYSPSLFREFCLPFLQESARMVHARGKYLFVHSCGRLKNLAPLLLESEVDCVEGQAHPPLGDWRLDEARELSPRLIVCGGMTAVEQQWTGPTAPVHIEQHVKRVMQSMGSKRRFLFGSGCNTAPDTPFENLLAFRDAVREHGGVT